MKNKIKLLAILFFAGIFSANAQQQQRTVEERVKMTMDRVKDSLQITADQQKGTETAFTNYYTAMNKLREGLQPGERPDRTQTDKLVSDRDEELKKVWTDAQFKHFKDMEAAMRQRQQQRPPGGN